MTSDEELRKLAERLERNAAGMLGRAASSAILSLMEERDEASKVVRDTLWMAGRYADGRMTYAVGMYNDAREIAEAGGYAGNAKPAIDGMRPEWSTLTERATLAETRLGKAMEALREIGDSDDVDNALDPERNKRIARTVLSEMERETTPSDPPASQSSALGDQESGR